MIWVYTQQKIVHANVWKRLIKSEFILNLLWKKITTSISIFISGSANCDPTFRSPAFSSSYVTLPSLSVSINVNISLITSTSSTDKCSAITYTILLNKPKYHELCCNSKSVIQVTSAEQQCRYLPSRLSFWIYSWQRIA